MKDDVWTVEKKYFSAGNIIVMNSSNLDEKFSGQISEIMADIEECEINGSGWTLHDILDLEVYINEFSLLIGGNHSLYFEVSKWVAKKHAVVNVNNKNDQKCFLWSLLAGSYEFEKHAERTTKYHTHNNNPFDNIFNYEGFNYPLPLKDAENFERINVYK